MYYVVEEGWGGWGSLEHYGYVRKWDVKMRYVFCELP